MIRSVEIKGLRGIQEGKLEDFTPLVILVGTNNSGKSTILDALLIGANPNVSDGILAAIDRRNGVKQKARWLVTQPASFPASIMLKTHLEEIYRTVDIKLSRSQTEEQVVVTGTVFTTNGHIGHADDEEILTPASTGTEISSLTFGDNGSAAYSRSVVSADGVPEVHLVDPEMGTRLLPLHELYTKVLEQGRRKEVRKLISDLMGGVEDVLILTEGNSPVLYLDYSSGSVPVAMAGEGVQSLLRTAMELASRPNGVVLLEEPEVHQHPGAIQQTARAIWAAIRRGIQVVISTHSLDLIDSLVFEVQNEEELNQMSVYRLLLVEGCLRSSRTAGSEITFARATIGEDLR